MVTIRFFAPVWFPILFLLSQLLFGSVHSETWRGLNIADENRCSEYNRKRDYVYASSIEDDIVSRISAIYGPYTGTCFNSTYETDIEHIIATSEAHDSGLCAQDKSVRLSFASDPLNLTLDSPAVNRFQKSGKDAAEWLPERNKCWFANRSVEVRLAYGLTIDRLEAEALERILSNCETTELEPLICHVQFKPLPRKVKGDKSVLLLYDDNGNGRITCQEARSHNIAPVHHDHPAHQFMRDGDGVVCE